jgi:hypothetical protein
MPPDHYSGRRISPNGRTSAESLARHNSHVGGRLCSCQAEQKATCIQVGEPLSALWCSMSVTFCIT